MFDLGSPRRPRGERGGDDLKPPPLQLTMCMRFISVLTLESDAIKVHYVAGATPMVRCNDDGEEACALCSLGFPVLERELLLVYDRGDDRLWAAPLPVELKEQLFEEAECLPDHERNFFIGWNGVEYHLEHDGTPQTSEFILAHSEQNEVRDLLADGSIDLPGAIPRLTNAAMLRLPAVTLAAIQFGVEGVSQDEVNTSDDSSVHW